MECPPNHVGPASPPAEGGRFTWGGLVLAMLIAPLFGLIWAWVANVVEAYAAPMIVFPVLLGVLAGWSIVGLARFAQIGHRPTILLAAVLTAAVTTAGQHYVGYLTTYYGPRSKIDTSAVTGPDLSALVQDLRPSFGKYMNVQAQRGRPLVAGYTARGWLAWLTWAIDALLVAAAAVAVTIPATQTPYCNRCGTWYRTIRSGRIDVPTSLRLATLVGVDEIDHPRTPRYRLSACQGGCGPTRCELSWEETNGTVSLARAWLDPASRNQFTEILDTPIVEEYETRSTQT